MPDNATLTPGLRVRCRDAEWLVTRVEPLASSNDQFAVHCVGADSLVRGHEAIFLTELETDITPVDPRQTELVADPTPGYDRSRLFLESHLRRMPATGLEPDLEGMGAFQAMGFQVNTVKHALTQLRPRLLLADAVGLGKTIQAGMILTELIRRGRADRILVLAKKSMLAQFQSELWNRFAIPLVRLDSEGIRRLRLRIPANKNPFEVFHRVIISIDTLKATGRYEHHLKNTRWDVVIIDEAHNVAGASVPERHQSYRLARLLSRRTDSMLLTTATPHNGKREVFGRLISLLDPSAIPDPSLREYDAEDIQGFFLMRFKEDVKNDVGGMLPAATYIPRNKTTADATRDEEAVYAALAGLRARLLEEKDRAGGQVADWAKNSLLEYGLYKSFLSSPEACLSTVRKRLGQLEAQDTTNPEISILKPLQKLLKVISIADTSRYAVLKKQFADIGWNGNDRSPRVLIFTESRKTQDALAEALAKDFGVKYSAKFEDQPRQAIATIHGGLPDIHLMKTVEAFATGTAPIRLLIATDVASEGINLHHECHHIIHYDLPWSIITLVQRNGRIDRLGQTESPVVRYLMVNTKQGLLQGDQAIFERLLGKVEQINSIRAASESVLKLYDPKLEEQHIAEEGILRGNLNVLEDSAAEPTQEASALERLLAAASINTENARQQLLADQLTESGADGAEQGRIRFFSDRDFLKRGYHYLSSGNRHYQPIQEEGRLMVLTAPDDLKRRLGIDTGNSGVIFGSTAIPEESVPENAQFRLTDDPRQVETAIKAARNLSGYWSKELLCTEQHPILQWINEKLLMEVERGKAPIILSPHLGKGELCFCFIGQVSSHAGTPLVVDAHAISFSPGGEFQHRSLRDALAEAKFESLSNAGKAPIIDTAQGFVSSAVEASLEHMRRLQDRHQKTMMPLLRAEERRLRRWRQRRKDILESEIDRYGENHPRARRDKRELDELEDYCRDREHNWRAMHCVPAKAPTTQLILVIEGRQ